MRRYISKSGTHAHFTQRISISMKMKMLIVVIYPIQIIKERFILSKILYYMVIEALQDRSAA